jgi:hypothetical protein
LLRNFCYLKTSLRPSQQNVEDAAYGDAADTAGISQKSNWELFDDYLFDDYNERNATAAYSELEWE